MDALKNNLGLLLVCCALACGDDGGGSGMETDTDVGEDPICGNGIIEAGEACDGPNVGNIACESLGFGPGQLLCGPLCSLDASACCGDGNIGIGENCDDNNAVPLDGCNGICDTEPGWSCVGAGPTVCTPDCGDGLVVGIETCDDANMASGDGCSGCATEAGWSCTQQPSVCVQSCGDGVLDPTEECDGDPGLSCESLGFAPGGTVSCTSNCTINTSDCEECGNGVADFFEDCDGFDLGFEDCLSQGQGDGVLACTPECVFDISGCGDCGNLVVDDGETCDPPDGITCGLDCQLLACVQCGELLAGAAGEGCCDAQLGYDTLEACVCLASDCATECGDTLCAGVDLTGDDCETCLRGSVDCGADFTRCVDATTEELGPEDFAEACADGCNNDRDLLVDCDDDDCFGVGDCALAELNCTDGEDNDVDTDVDCDDTDCAGDPGCVIECVPDDGGNPIDFEIAAGNDTFADAIDLTPHLAGVIDNVIQTIGDVTLPLTTVAVCEDDADYYLVPDAMLSEPCFLLARVQGAGGSVMWTVDILDPLGAVLDTDTGDVFAEATYDGSGVEDLVVRVHTTAPGASVGQPYELRLRCVGS